LDIYKHISRTPLIPYSGPTGTWQHLWLKNETEQVTGSFKFRGNIAKLATLPAGTHVVTASTGNHGLGLSKAAQIYQLSATVFVPEATPLIKLRGIRENGAQTVPVNGDYATCESVAREYALSRGYTFISSFDDEGIIEGHRSLFKEIDEAHIDVDIVFVPVGGGGLISACIKQWGDSSKHIIGVQASLVPAMKLSLDEGARVTLPEVHGPAESLLVRQVGEIPFRYCSSYKPEIITLEFTEMERAVRLLWEYNGIRAEVASAAPLAAALSYTTSGVNGICIISGGNIDDDYHKEIINRF
jgi:threonine dehydratase